MGSIKNLFILKKKCKNNIKISFVLFLFLIMTKRTLIENNVLARVAQLVNIGKYGLCYMVLGSRFGSSLRVLKLGHERLKKKKKTNRTEQV